jgi:hypothetical protein
MADAFKLLNPGNTLLNTSPVAVYTSPAAGSGVVKDIEIFNASAASASVTLYVAGSASQNTLAVAPLDVSPAGATRQGNIMLTGGQALYAKSSVASAAIIHCFGMEIT